MRWVAEVRERLRGVFLRGEEDAAMAEEMSFHIEREAERLIREPGLEPLEARRRAAIAFGGLEKHKEEVRNARAWRGCPACRWT